MNAPLIRPAAAEDIPDILECWALSFGDPPELVRELLAAGALLRCAVAAETDGRVRSVMFAFEHQMFGALDVAYLYALCTHPDARNRGLGSAVLRGLIARCRQHSADAVMLCPASESLADFYRDRFGFRTFHCFQEHELTPEPADFPCIRLSPEEYRDRRGGHLLLSRELLEAQSVLLDARGGFFRVALPSGDAYACADVSDGVLSLPELLCDPDSAPLALGALCRHLGCGDVLLRSRAAHGRPMLVLPSEGVEAQDFPPESFLFSLD